MFLKMLIFVIIANIAGVGGYTISDITPNLFLGRIGDNLAAFGDFNGDKLIDIFAITNKSSVSLFYGSDKRTAAYQAITLIPAESGEPSISSVVPGDFDGDAQMDVLITRNLEGGGVKVQVYWGESGSKVGDFSVIVDDMMKEITMKDQPLVLDWDANMIPDLLAENMAGKKRMRWFANYTSEVGSKARRTFLSEDFPKGNPNWDEFKQPHSNAFVDIDHDYAADLALTTITNEFEIWMNLEGSLKFNKTIKPPFEDSSYYYGQAVWTDIDQDSDPDLLLPVCKSQDCKESFLYVYHRGDWELLVDDGFKNDDNTKYGYVTPDKNPAKRLLSLDLPVTLRTGDFDMDGYPDILVLLREVENDKAPSVAYLMMNSPCTDPTCAIERTYKVLWSSEVSNTVNVAQVTFFDIYEDGILDIFMVAEISDKNTLALRALKNTYSADACFLKITVVSGLCFNDCPENRLPYGVNQPGIAVKYKTTKPNGAPTQGCATQLSQSAHFALQLPYTIFGLGQMPNFVDQLSVGIPRPPEAKDTLMREWPQIIPNSQLMVIPYPIDKPSYWKMKLYVQPSEAILITGAVLVGCLGVLAAILGGLHWRERKEDKEEKKQEAQKFHFDAM